MPRGKAIPTERRFPNPVKFSSVVDEKTKLNIDIIAGELVEKFGYMSTQGQVVDYIANHYRNCKQK